MSLEAILAARRERSVGRIKPEYRELQERHIAELRATGLDRVLSVGERAPSFELPNSGGATISSAKLLENGPLIVSFFRSAWCPYCVAELEALDEIVPALAELGGTVVVITPQKPQRTADLVAAKGLRFDVLTDEDNRTADAFGVGYAFPDYLRELYRDVLKHDLAEHNAAGKWKLPIPARFVIDRTGIIREAKADPDYRHRPEPADSLEIVRGLTAAA